MIYNSTSFFSVSEKMSPLEGTHCMLLKPFFSTCFQTFPISFLLKSSVAPLSRMSSFLLKLFHFKNSRIKEKKKGTVCLTLNSPWLHPFLCHLSWWKSHLHLQPLISFLYSSVQFSSVTQSCLTLCDPMDCSTPGLPVHHQLPEFAQTHVHWVGDAIQPSQPSLLSLLELGLYVHCAYKAE